MKNLLLLSLVMCVFCAVGASGQTIGGVLSSQPQVFEVPDHPAQATQLGMGQERSIMERSMTVSGRGEKPLWEAMQEAPERPVTPLGDSARELKKEHASLKKATVVWSN